MNRAQSVHTSSAITLDVFRSQIRQFKRAHIIPQFDDLFEKDAIISALRRIDPVLPDSNAHIHADIIIGNQMTTPTVNDEDIKFAICEMQKRHRSIRYQLRYILTQIHAQKQKHVPLYWKRVMRLYRKGKLFRPLIPKQIFTSFGHTA